MENAESHPRRRLRAAALRGLCAVLSAAGASVPTPATAQSPLPAPPSSAASELPPSPQAVSSRRRGDVSMLETFSAKTPVEMVPPSAVANGPPQAGKTDGETCRPQAACDAPACRAPWWGPPAAPSPQGTFLNAWRSAQVARAEESRLTFFRDEWFQGGAKLGPAGRDHLEEVAAVLRAAPQPVTIVPATVVVAEDDDVDAACERAAALDAARRRNLAEALARAGVPAALELVRTARPIAEGLDGNEANRVYRGQIGGGQGGQSGGGGFGGGMGAGSSGGGATGGGGLGVR